MTIAIVDDDQQEIDSFLSVIKEYSLSYSVKKAIHQVTMTPASTK